MGNNLFKFFDDLTVRLIARDRRGSLLGPSPVENRS
jgi:hypothetical protein